MADTKKRYRASGLAVAYTGLHENTEYTAKHVRKGEPRGGWVYVFFKRKKVFDCNPIFFRRWFHKR